MEAQEHPCPEYTQRSKTQQTCNGIGRLCVPRPSLTPSWSRQRPRGRPVTAAQLRRRCPLRSEAPSRHLAPCHPKPEEQTRMPSQYHRVPPSRSGCPASSAWCAGAPGVITNSSQTHQKMPIFSRYRVGRSGAKHVSSIDRPSASWRGKVSRSATVVDRGAGLRAIVCFSGRMNGGIARIAIFSPLWASHETHPSIRAQVPNGRGRWVRSTPRLQQRGRSSLKLLSRTGIRRTMFRCVAFVQLRRAAGARGSVGLTFIKNQAGKLSNSDGKAIWDAYDTNNNGYLDEKV